MGSLLELNRGHLSGDSRMAARHADRINALADGRIIAAGETGRMLTPDLLSRLYEVNVQAIPSRDGAYFSYAL